ncbi:hypothetical protein C8Q76DRAFT_758016 [Earliella scabrosa]|nr:hypothetical protein C8Q76DRAFT_758016 [Earliella scabrosa]
MLTLQSIPPELWKEIVALACTDGGYTGRSLALTCKFMHAQSHSSRFHSVALTSLQHLEDLLKLLRQAQDESVPVQSRPMIEHLYLSFMDETCRSPPDFWRIRRCMSQEEAQGHDQKVASEKQAWDARFVPAMTELLALAGPTLRTLCILEEPAVRLPPFECGVLPRLEELTLHGYIPPFFPIVQVPCRDRSPVESELPPAEPSSKLPALQRLHVVHAWGHNEWCGDVVNSLAQLSPSNFTHLRLSNVQEHGLLLALSRALGVPLEGYDASAATRIELPSKLPQVRQVITQGYSPAPGGFCGNPYMEWDGFCDELEEFAQECKSVRGIRMLHLDRPWRRNRRWKERLRDDWLDRIEGRDACWVQSVKEEAGREVYEDDPASHSSEDEDYWR